MDPDNTLSDFVTLTDRKTLFKKIGECVRIGKTIEREELTERRNRLRNLLDNENTVYETEWSEKVMRRRAEDIARRTAAVKEHNRQKEEIRQEFLTSANIKRNILTCPEIRNAISEKEMKHARIVQLQQIDERLRNNAKERESDKIWQEINRRRLDDFNETQTYEDGLRKCINSHLVHVWNLQCEDHEIQKEKERQEKQKEKIECQKIIKETQMWEFDKKLRKLTSKKDLDYKRDLINQIAENAAKRQNEICNEYLYANAARERYERLTLDRENQIKKDKRAFLADTLDYIRYTKRMRNLKKFENDVTEKCLEEAARVTHCTDRNRAYDLVRRTKEEKTHFEELKKQINRIAERKEEEERYRKAPAFTRFMFTDKIITKEQKQHVQRKVSRDLIQQMKDNKEFHEKEEKEYEAQFTEPYQFGAEVCQNVANEYIREGIDYTPVHENWIIHECARNRKYLEKKRRGSYECAEKEIQPCGCKGRGVLSKCGEMKIYEMIS